MGREHCPWKVVVSRAKKGLKFNPMTAPTYWANKALGNPIGDAANKAKKFVPEAGKFMSKTNNAIANGYGQVGQTLFGVDKKKSARAFKAGERAAITAASFIPVAKGGAIAASVVKQSGWRALAGEGGKDALKAWISSPGSPKAFAEERLKGTIAAVSAKGKVPRYSRAVSSAKNSKTVQWLSKKFGAAKSTKLEWWKKNSPSVGTAKDIYGKGKGWLQKVQGVEKHQNKNGGSR